MLSKRYAESMEGPAADQTRGVGVRRNKLFGEVMKDIRKMENRMRQQRMEEELEGSRGGVKAEFYVDRDRSAALTMGSKDIKRQMRGSTRVAAAEAEKEANPTWLVLYKSSQQQVHDHLILFTNMSSLCTFADCPKGLQHRPGQPQPGCPSRGV